MAAHLRKLLLGAVALLAVGAPLAASGGDKIDCNNAMNQNEMNRCAGDSFAATDAKLNKLYKALMAKLEGGEQDQLRTAQRAWLSYRDSECTFTIRANEGGSIYPMMWSGCLESQTTRRIKELQAHLDCVNGKDSCTE